MRFFWKIGKLALFSIKFTPKLTIWVENSEKLDFSVKQVRIFIVSTNNYMWIHISTVAKTIVFPHRIEVEILHKLYPAKTSKIIVENTKNLAYLSSYTIENKIVRNSHLLSHKNWHFLKCHTNCSTNKCRLLTHKSIKAAIDCSYVYCEGKCDKVLQTCTFLFNTLLYSLVLESQLTLLWKIQNK